MNDADERTVGDVEARLRDRSGGLDRRRQRPVGNLREVDAFGTNRFVLMVAATISV